MERAGTGIPGLLEQFAHNDPSGGFIVYHQDLDLLRVPSESRLHWRTWGALLCFGLKANSNGRAAAITQSR